MNRVNGWLRHRNGGLVLLALLVAGYLAAYFGHELFPGLGPDASTRGWWTWSDQNRYRQESIAVAGLHLDASTYWYPIGYPLLGAVFVSWLPQHPFLIPDVLMVIVAAVSWWRIGRRWLDPLLVVGVGLSFVLTHRWLVAQTMVIPWNTLPTQTTLLAAIWLILERSDIMASRWLAILASVTYLMRPIDALAFAPLLVFATLRLPNWRTRIAAGLTGIAIILVTVVAVGWMNLLLVGSWRTTYDVISTRVIGFFGYPVCYKFFWLFVDGQPLFQEKDVALLFRYPWLFLVPVGLMFVVTREGAKGWAAMLAVGINVFLYANYNDLLPSDLYRFTLIHYIAWTFPLLFLLVAAGLAQSWRKRRVRAGLCASVLFVLLCAGLRLEPREMVAEAKGERRVRLPETRPLRLRFDGTPMEAVASLRLEGHGLTEYSQYIGPYVESDLEILLGAHATGAELTSLDVRTTWPPKVSRYVWRWRLTPERLKVWR